MVTLKTQWTPSASFVSSLRRQESKGRHDAAAILLKAAHEAIDGSMNERAASRNLYDRLTPLYGRLAPAGKRNDALMSSMNSLLLQEMRRHKTK